MEECLTIRTHQGRGEKRIRAKAAGSGEFPFCRKKRHLEMDGGGFPTVCAHSRLRSLRELGEFYLTSILPPIKLINKALERFLRATTRPRPQTWGLGTRDAQS